MTSSSENATMAQHINDAAHLGDGVDFDPSRHAGLEVEDDYLRHDHTPADHLMHRPTPPGVFRFSSANTHGKPHIRRRDQQGLLQKRRLHPEQPPDDQNAFHTDNDLPFKRPSFQHYRDKRNRTHKKLKSVRDTGRFVSRAGSNGVAAPDSGGSRGTHRPTDRCTPRYKRPAHIDAEYRRRSKIQKGFESVQRCVPLLAGSGTNIKYSKTHVLSTCAQYLQSLESDVVQNNTELEKLRAEVDSLQNEIEEHQKLLPSGGAAFVERPGCQHARMLDDYLKTSIRQNWKFWIFSFLVRPLSESFARIVSRSTHDDFLRTMHEWSNNQLSLVNLRPMVLSLLRRICTSTSVLTQPEKMEQEVMSLQGEIQSTAAILAQPDKLEQEVLSLLRRVYNQVLTQPDKLEREVLSPLRRIFISTSVLTHPEKLEQEVLFLLQRICISSSLVTHPEILKQEVHEMLHR